MVVSRLALPGREARVAECRVVLRSLGDGALQLLAERLGLRARGHQVLHANELARFLEDRPGAVGDQRSNATPIAGFGVSPDVASGAAADRAHRELVARAWAPLLARAVAGSVAVDPLAPRGDRCCGVPPVCWMPSMRTGRPLASIVRARRRLSNPSQPSETRSAPPTFGCVHSFSIIASAYAFG
jgi:hypothetical protein